MKNSTKLKEDQQLLFLKRLNRLLNNGYSLTDALEIIKWDKDLKRAAEVINQELTIGKYIDETFKTAGFHVAIVSYLYFVRINGDMLTSLEKCIDMFEHRLRSYGKFKQVIRYPAVLLGFFIVLLLFLKFSVLPSFAEMFQSSDESSRSIMVSITIINVLSTIAILGVLMSVIGGIFWRNTRERIPVEKRILLYNKVPIFRYILRLQTSYYFATHMSMFLKTGMSMKNVIIQMTNQRELPLIAHYAGLMKVQLQNGYYVDHLLEQMDFIEKQITSIFKHNQNIDDLQQDLMAYADFLTETMERKMTRMITLIQPVFFSMLACLIIFIYLTLMWPMFQLINTL